MRNPQRIEHADPAAPSRLGAIEVFACVILLWFALWSAPSGSAWEHVDGDICVIHGAKSRRRRSSPVVSGRLRPSGERIEVAERTIGPGTTPFPAPDLDSNRTHGGSGSEDARVPPNRLPRPRGAPTIRTSRDFSQMLPFATDARSHPRVRSTPAPRRGFTLVEVLVVVAVVAVLLAILIPAASSVRTTARESVERSAARSLLTAWNRYAFDHRGRLLPGYKSGLPAFDPSGRPIDGQSLGVAAARYPWRIAPYLGGAVENLTAPSVAGKLDGRRASDDPEYLYLASLHPRFGLNGTFVGGDEGTGGFNTGFEAAFGRFYRTSLGEIRRPESLMVFTSAASIGGSLGAPEIVDGYFRVKAPRFTSPQWDEASDPEDPASVGHVDPRWSGRAVIGFVSGEVDARPVEGLRDMRLWADQADAFDWTLASHGGG